MRIVCNRRFPALEMPCSRPRAATDHGVGAMPANDPNWCRLSKSLFRHSQRQHCGKLRPDPAQPQQQRRGRHFGGAAVDAASGASSAPQLPARHWCSASAVPPPPPDLFAQQPQAAAGSARSSYEVAGGSARPSPYATSAHLPRVLGERLEPGNPLVGKQPADPLSAASARPPTAVHATGGAGVILLRHTRRHHHRTHANSPSSHDARLRSSRHRSGSCFRVPACAVGC